MTKIDFFRDEFFFLSNFYDTPCPYMGYTFRNAECAFQAAKCPCRAEEFLSLPGNRAKKLGRSVPIRTDWELVKDTVMRDVCLSKFTNNRKILFRLIATGDAYLEEGNTWGDRCWGTVNGEGENRLGKILMDIREELKQWYSPTAYRTTFSFH